ncbi:hypothetical protein AMTRI_Chr11g155000 [Amborella trichopoda]
MACRTQTLNPKHHSLFLSLTPGDIVSPFFLSLMPDLPPGSCSIPKGISPSVSCRSDVAMDQGLSTPENDRTMFFEKGERTDEPCVRLSILLQALLILFSQGRKFNLVQ